jgi:hypothetical protein
MYAKTILAMNVSSGQSRMPNRIIAAEIPDSFAIFFSFLVFILLMILFMIDLLFCVGVLCWPALWICKKVQSLNGPHPWIDELYSWIYVRQGIVWIIIVFLTEDYMGALGGCFDVRSTVCL